jgi:hypothetical protein
MLRYEGRNEVNMEVLIWVYNWFDEEKQVKTKSSVDGQSLNN